ncbi:histidine phosphatase family protein [Streptomyces sp. WMMC897]|uniref:histidine phosphatase family protein n=1 Tax=Streptomyces sp. WMMC897 TaxID=3014782 RepID=UPI003FCDB0B9
MRQVIRRVTAVRDGLVARHAGATVLVVSHVGPLRTLLRLALQAPPHTLFRHGPRGGLPVDADPRRSRHRHRPWGSPA